MIQNIRTIGASIMGSIISLDKKLCTNRRLINTCDIQRHSGGGITMKMLALNGSGKGKNGNTDRILQPFLQGARKAGAEIETIYLKDKKINHCSGCFSCWTKTLGSCVYKDDMQELLIKILESDIVVFASPLYYYSVTGIMKDFIDRMLPLHSREKALYNGHYIHQRHDDPNHLKKYVLISNCGLPEYYNFSSLLEEFKLITHNNLIASVLRSQGGILQNENLEDILSNYFAYVEKAGTEVVELGYITSETNEVLNKQLIDQEVYVKNANEHWQFGD